MEGEATAEGAVAKVSHVRYSLPRSYAWVRTAEGTARRVIVLWDTGATHTIINPKIVADLNLVVKKGQGPTLLSMADDHTQKCSGVVQNLQILAGQFKERVDMIVADIGSDDIIVGNDILEPACGGHGRGKPGFWQMIKGETIFDIPLIGEGVVGRIEKVSGVKKIRKLLQNHGAHLRVVHVRKTEDFVSSSNSLETELQDKDGETRGESEAARGTEEVPDSARMKAALRQHGRRYAELERRMAEDKAEFDAKSEQVKEQLKREFPDFCLQRPTCIFVVRVGREEEGVSSLRAELAAMARALQAAPAESDLIYLCDSEAALNKISRWIGSGPRTTLAGDANADIMISIIERIRERVQKGARTFMVKVKAHRGEPLNEKADTQAENARQLQDDCRQWTVRTPSMTYEWSDSNGVKRTTAWSKAVRKAMVRGGAEYQVQEATNHAVTNWRKTFLRDTNAGLHSISHAASKGAQGDLMSNERWGRECMLQLQELNFVSVRTIKERSSSDENWNKPTTTTWAAEFLLREGESRELLGSWIRSGAVPEAKKRRAKQVITCSFPCGQWLYKIGARANPRCELCRRERETRGASIDSLPPETVAHIQSAGCNLQKKSVIGAHNRCWKYLIGAISTHGEAKRSLEVLGGDKDRQLHTLWKETKIGEILPWEDIEEEEEELIARSRVERRASASNQANQQREDESGGDEKDPSEEVIFGQRRPDSLAIDWTNKMVYVLEFKRTSDQRRDYREKAESRARAQHDVLIRSLEKVAGETESEGERWKVKLIVFVGGTCGSVHVQTFNCNLKELGVLESKRGAIRKGLVQELLYAQDTVLCSYFAQREGATNGDKGRRSTAAEVFQGLDRFG
jgi:ribonuclease HI